MADEQPAKTTALAREVYRFAVYGVLFAILTTAAVRLGGCIVRVEKLGGTTRGTSVVDLGPRPPAPVLADDFAADAEVRNVILLLADGLGLPHIVAGRSELVGLNGRLTFERMPVVSWFTTHEASSLITDSAAGGTVLASGEKTDLGALSQSPEGRPLRTLVEAAQEAGMAAGLVTDTYIWDATPAAFLVHVASRRERLEVMSQIGRSGAELVIGEWSSSLSAEDEDGRAIVADLTRQGYTVAGTWEELRAIEAGRRVAGLLAPGVIPDPDRGPSQAELADFALGRLAEEGEGFFLLVEVEETDTASHRREFPRLIAGIRSLDEVAKRALDFARRDRSTLVLLTADHETGGLSLLSGRDGEKLGIHWSTYSHSGAPVPLYAYGPGARRFSAVRDNTEVAAILAELLGLRL